MGPPQNGNSSYGKTNKTTPASAVKSPYLFGFDDSIDATEKWFVERAIEINDHRVIPLINSALDGCALFSSMVRYYFDLHNPQGGIATADAMHVYLTSLEGLIAMFVGSLGLSLFSFLGNYFKKDDEDWRKAYLAVFLAYFRDVVKALKNAYKGIRAVLIAAALFTGVPLSYAIIPLGLLFGVLSMFNRMLIRRTKDWRDDIQKHNIELLAEINATTGPISEDQIRQWIACIDKHGRESFAFLVLCYISTLYGGMIDSGYLFGGSATIVVFASYIFPCILGACVIFMLTCAFTRLAEQCTLQRDLKRTADSVVLKIQQKKIQQLFNEPYEKNALVAAVNDFIEARSRMLYELRLSWFQAWLNGLGDGLAWYGGLGLLVVALSAFSAAAFSSVSVILVAGSIAAGIGLLLMFSIMAVIDNASFRAQQDPRDAELISELRTVLNAPNNVNSEALDNALTACQYFTPNSNARHNARGEVWRSFDSGLLKAQKAVETLFGGLQVQDEDGHYRDSPIMFALMLPFAVFYATIFALSALADGFGKKPKEPPIYIKKQTSIEQLRNILANKEENGYANGNGHQNGLVDEETMQDEKQSVSDSPLSSINI